MQEMLRKTSWLIMTLSLLIDMISHTRAFPSYNIVIGVFAWYAAQHSATPNNHLPIADEKDNQMSLNILSSFTIITLLSLIFDVCYCFIWGGEIIDGDVRSIKFSFALFILNMLPKAVVVLFAVAIQIDINDASIISISRDNNNNDISSIHSVNQQNDSSINFATPKRVRFVNDDDNDATSNEQRNNNNNSLRKRSIKITQEQKIPDSENTRKKNIYISSLFPNSSSPIENISFDGSSDSDDNLVHNNTGPMKKSNSRSSALDDIPLPPFSPVVPGLISPVLRKPKFGVTPPLPPSPPNSKF